MRGNYKLAWAILFILVISTLFIFNREQVEQLKEQEQIPTAIIAIEATKEIPTEEPEQQSGLGVLSCSNFTAAELAIGLHEPLKEYAECFIQAERDTGVNAIFLASVAALESGWAKSEVAIHKNNLFGWTAKSGYASFDSKEECIAFVASRLKALYLTPEGAYFNGYEVADVNVCYNGRQSWADTVTQIMGEITYRINEVKEG